MEPNNPNRPNSTEEFFAQLRKRKFEELKYKYEDAERNQ